MDSIKNSYVGDSDSDDSDDETTLHLKPMENKNMAICAAPEVITKQDVQTSFPIDPKTKVLKYNPKFEDLYAPTVGPENPLKTNQMKAHKNSLAGYYEKCHVNDSQFNDQRLTFINNGYAMDPSVTGSEVAGQMIGDLENAREKNNTTTYETKNSKKSHKRKRIWNDDASDVDGYTGSWGKYEDEITVSGPTGEDKEYCEAYLAKTKKRAKIIDDKPTEETSKLHIKEPIDYQGRSFMCEPKNTGTNLRSSEPPAQCFIPKKLIYTWEGHNRGVSTIKWFPVTAHLLLSCGNDSMVKLWQVYGNRHLVRSYTGHRLGVRDICFNNPGTEFLSCSLDRYIKLWDTETGVCKGRFTNGKESYCVKFHPEDDMQHLFVAGTKDKKILCWDVRSNEIVQDYDRHLGAVNTITFVDQNRRFVTTSDDKSLRVWEWDIPVDFKYIADPSMHSMPAVRLSPNGKWLACQSMDNQIVIFNAINKFKFERKKVFKGHMVAGFACGLDFSPDMSYLASGDGDGMVNIWNWSTTRSVSRFKAHDKATIDCLWHPHETSKIVTAGWDGLIKLWD